MESPETYDLLILVDATYSMSNYLESLQSSLPKIIAISALTDCFSRIGLLAYRDYCDTKLLEWSGWLSHSIRGNGEDGPDLVAMAKSLDPMGGGDYAEATKTGLAKAYEVMRPEATTIIFIYTDAPPHSLFNGSMTEEWSNLGKEKKALLDPKSYGGFGPDFADWVSASRMLHSGDKKAQVFCILEPHMNWEFVGHYNYLSTMTRGACLYLKNDKPLSISEVTVEVLLAWMGAEKSGLTETKQLQASLSRYISVQTIKNAKNETDPAANLYFAATGDDKEARKRIQSNITEIRITTEILKKHLPKKKTPVQDFAKRYAVDEEFKGRVVEHLKTIIDEDVSAVSLNPVFGSLWRAVCNDRNNEARDNLITAFGLQVDRIRDQGEKDRMKTWLEESYDYTAEVIEAIESVPEDQRFPCVLLDPTLAYIRAADDQDPEVEDEDNRPITEFRRDELLEIGRSCDYRILRRLGRVLTRLTFVNSAEELPAHIASTAEADIPKIPMALASKEYGAKFWRILLHIVVPGTMLSARPAALLAALSIRLGVQPLLTAADTEMLRWRSKWNNLEIPETWNVSCLSLLLDADAAYKTRIQKQEEKLSASTTSLLKEDDRALFERLVEYKMLELNFNTTLTAKVGWTPEKTTIPMGPMATCRDCKCPRSVTIMGKHGRCGLCAAEDYISPDQRQKYIDSRVTHDDNEKTQATWVECFVRVCRGQYVVYNVDALNVRPKCHYCRSAQLGPAPKVECTQCLSQIIWPEEYRPTSLDTSTFKCPACTHNRTTIVSIETSVNKLTPENSTSWLLLNTNNKLPEPFNNRSLFHTITTAGPVNFTSLVTLFPRPNPILNLRGKLIRNAPDLLSQLQSFVSRRRTESLPCSLCFSNFRHSALHPSCGRSGCSQRLCTSCLKSWYGLNSSGRLLNTAALYCPFCRRAPAAKTLANYGMGVHAVGGLQNAIAERGEWVYAWCAECGFARRCIERVCARGAPHEVSDWICEECNEAWEAMEEADGDAIDVLLTEQENDDAENLRQIQGRVGGNRETRALRAGYMLDPMKRANRVGKTKKCPGTGCGVVVQKAWGCNHMCCPRRECGIHWCWICNGVFGPDEIYGHLQQEHGGFFGNED